MLRTEPSTPLAQASQIRVSSIDVEWSLAIVIMALDYVRDLWHTTALVQYTLSFDKFIPSLFLMCWVRHFAHLPLFRSISLFQFKLKRGTDIF